MNTKEQWEEEFRKKFTSVWNSKHNEFIRIPDAIKENIIDFIRETREQAYKEGYEEGYEEGWDDCRY